MNDMYDKRVLIYWVGRINALYIEARGLIIRILSLHGMKRKHKNEISRTADMK